MSDRVTWGVCPNCGRPAAIGWAAIPPLGDRPAQEAPVEVDCLGHCRLDVDALAQALLRSIERPEPHRTAQPAALALLTGNPRPAPR